MDTFSINQRKLRDWMATHRLVAREVADWWNCSASYIAKLRSEAGAEPSAQFSRDVPACMKKVPRRFRTHTFKWGDWYEYAKAK